MSNSKLSKLLLEAAYLLDDDSVLNEGGARQKYTESLLKKAKAYENMGYDVHDPKYQEVLEKINKYGSGADKGGYRSKETEVYRSGHKDRYTGEKRYGKNNDQVYVREDDKRESSKPYKKQDNWDDKSLSHTDRDEKLDKIDPKTAKENFNKDFKGSDNPSRRIETSAKKTTVDKLLHREPKKNIEYKPVNMDLHKRINRRSDERSKSQNESIAILLIEAAGLLLENQELNKSIRDLEKKKAEFHKNHSERMKELNNAISNFGKNEPKETENSKDLDRISNELDDLLASMKK